MRTRSAGLGILAALFVGCQTPSPLHQAAEGGDASAVEAGLAQSGDLSERGLNGRTALHQAAAAGQQDVAALLLDKGADPSAGDSCDTPLHSAAQAGHSEIVSLLIDWGADPAPANCAGKTAAQLAEEGGHEEAGAVFSRALAVAPEPEQAPALASSEPAGGISREELQSALEAAVKKVGQAPAKPPEEEPVSDVDEPGYRLSPNSKGYALVIGIDQYKGLPPADYAARDAKAMKAHLLAMGFPQRNIIHLDGNNATRTGMQSYLEEWLPNNVKPDSRVFFYFSGHGSPDPQTGEAYLLPWDANVQFLKTTAYPLKQLYAALGSLKAKETVVALDACFSGAGGRSVLPKGARPLVTRVNQGLSTAHGLVLLTAASSDEITSTLEEQGHGLFTYFLLKGLSGGAKDGSGIVTAGGLYEYLRPMVEDEARRQNRQQTPTLNASDPGRVIVKF